MAALLFLIGPRLNAAEPVLETGEQERRATAIAYSPDGKTLAVADDGSEVSLLDASTGKRIGALPGNIGANRICWSPDGRTIYGIDGNHWLAWDVASRAVQRKVACEMTRTGPRCFAVSADGKLIATAGNGVIKLWETATGKTLGEYEVHPNYGITSVAFSRDGRWVATTSGDDTAKITNAATGEAGPILACDRDTVWAEFSPDGKTLFVSDKNPTLHQFEAASGKDEPTPVPRGEAKQLVVSPDGTLVAYAGSARVCLWSRTEKVWHELAIANTALGTSAVAFSPDGKRIATAGTNRGILIWNVSDVLAAK